MERRNHPVTTRVQKRPLGQIYFYVERHDTNISKSVNTYNILKAGMTE